MYHKYRDIQLIETGGKKLLAIACDVSAGIGSMKMDEIQLSPLLTGYYATAVPLIELLAIGARPISIADTLGLPMNDMGIGIVDGIRKAMDEADVPFEALTGSTEDNITTVMTSVGITVTALIDKKTMKKNKPKNQEEVHLVGVPKMGKQFLEEEIIKQIGEVISINHVQSIRKIPGITHMLPVGSKGILYELGVLEEAHGCFVVTDVSSAQVDLMASAGPATCMIVTCSTKAAMALRKDIQLPMVKLGHIRFEP